MTFDLGGRLSDHILHVLYVFLSVCVCMFVYTCKCGVCVSMCMCIFEFVAHLWRKSKPKVPTKHYMP